MNDRAIEVGLIGYGLGGAVFHAPLIAAVPRLRIRSVVTGDPQRAAAARSRYPEVTVYSSADELFAAAGDHDLVVVAAPNRAHVPLALRALEAGLHVVVDKPLAASVADAERLAAAVGPGLVASVFQNRRWDGDFLTLRRLVDGGRLGEVWRFESRFERWRPVVSADAWRERGDPADAGGLLFDLGAHLIDQALCLLGPVTRVYAEVLARRERAEVDDDTFVALDHASGARSHLWASSAAAAPGPRMRVLGSRAAYVKHGLDVQEDQLASGAVPGDAGFGLEPASAWGRLVAGDASEPVETEAGRYVDFYAGVERAVRSGGPPPVPLAAGIEVLRVIEAALESARTARVVVV